MLKDEVLFRHGFSFFFISHDGISSNFVTLTFHFHKTFKTLLVFYFQMTTICSVPPLSWIHLIFAFIVSNHCLKISKFVLFSNWTKCYTTALLFKKKNFRTHLTPVHELVLAVVSKNGPLSTCSDERTSTPLSIFRRKSVLQPKKLFKTAKQQKSTKMSKTALSFLHTFAIQTRSRQSQNMLARHSNFKEMFKLAKYRVIFAMSLRCA